MLYFLEAAAEETTNGGMNMVTMILSLVAMGAIFYFMMIRPESKRKKEAENLRSSIRTGDKVTTIGGIMGTVVDVKEDSVVIETSADRVRMELAKWGISTNDSAAERAKEEAKKAEEAKAREKAEKKAAKGK